MSNLKWSSDQELIHRFNYLIGHLQGVKKMVENNAYCIDIVNQNLGVIAAIKKIDEKLISNHIDHCVAEAIRGNDAKEREKKLVELQDVIKRI